MPAKDYAGTCFSELDAVTIINANNLKLAWSFDIRAESGAQTVPIVVGTTMFVFTPFPNVLYALDLNPTAGPNRVKWTYSPESQPASNGVASTGLKSPGACYAEGRVFINTWEGHTIAVDAATGAEIWKRHVANLDTGEALTMAPLVVAGKVLVGSSGGQAGGWLKALDAASGTLLWTAYNPGPHADVKGWIAYDPGLHTVYYANATPNPPDSEQGGETWTCAIFARDPDTGEARWSYQRTSHDASVCDVTENILIDLAMSRHTRRVLFQAERNGNVYVLDRTTGDVISTTPSVPVTSRTAVQLGRAVNVTQSQPPAAYSPRTGLLYIPQETLARNAETPGAGAHSYLAASVRPVPAVSTKAASRLLAWDPLAKKAAWTLEERFPVRSGALVTAGDVLFYGTSDGQLKAVNARNGKALWAFKTNRGTIGQPMTYLGADGKQYVAVLSGSGANAGQRGERLLVFSLP